MQCPTKPTFVGSNLMTTRRCFRLSGHTTHAALASSRWTTLWAARAGRTSLDGASTRQRGLTTATLFVPTSALARCATLHCGRTRTIPSQTCCLVASSVALSNPTMSGLTITLTFIRARSRSTTMQPLCQVHLPSVTTVYGVPWYAVIHGSARNPGNVNADSCMVTCLPYAPHMLSIHVLTDLPFIVPC
jgi:hypothetical protein